MNSTFEKIEPLRNFRNLTLSAGLIALLASGSAADATTLTFDVIPDVNDGIALDQYYGDRVTAANSDSTGTGASAAGSYTVGAEGATGNVNVNYVGGLGSSANHWGTGFGDLTNVYYRATGGNSSLGVEFIADAGFEVALHGFDVAGWSGISQQYVTSIEVFGADSKTDPLWSTASMSIPNTGHLSFQSIDFGTLQSTYLLLTIGVVEGSSTDNIAFDNITFSQSTDASPVPVPPALPLLGTGLAIMGFLGWRRKHTTAT